MTAEIQGQQTYEFTCNGCQQKMYVAVPTPQFVNQPKFSMMVLTHEEPEKCPSCGKVYACAIAGIDNGLQLTWLEMAKRPTNAIVPPTAQQVAAVEKMVPIIHKMGG